MNLNMLSNIEYNKLLITQDGMIRIQIVKDVIKTILHK